MSIGLDWVSVGVVVAALVIFQIRTLPLAWRYGLNAVAFGGLALYRLSTASGRGTNMIFVIGAGALAVYDAYRAFQTRRPRA
jgi:hypothetical protein